MAYFHYGQSIMWQIGQGTARRRSGGLVHPLSCVSHGVRYRNLDVILTTNIDKHGKAGEIVKVAPGYFSNYLTPKLLAVPNIERFAYSIREQRKCSGISMYLYSSKSNRPMSRAYRRRVNRRLKLSNKPVLDEARFYTAVSKLPPRFTADDLHDVIALEDDPLVCLELFDWASQQRRFMHNVNSYHIVIKTLGMAKMYQEMDDVVNQVLAVPHIGSEGLYNTMIYYFTEARKLTRAINIFKHMKGLSNLKCRPSIRTYNLLFGAFLSRRSNTYVNHMYMETMRCLFRQLVNDGIEPDIFTLNSIIKGYVLSNHVNDALRIFHQMGVVYSCQPNGVSYDHIIHGLCAQGRTNNARELFNEMKGKGFICSSRTYNSLVNSLALGGEIEEAVRFLNETIEKQKPTDFITYKTVLDELCRQGRVKDSMNLLKHLRDRDLIDEPSYRKLLCVLEDDFAYGRDEQAVVRNTRSIR